MVKYSKRRSTTSIDTASAADDSKSKLRKSLIHAWSFASKKLKIFIGIIGLTSASVFSYFAPIFEPLRDAINRNIWSERAEISVICSPCSLSAGQSTSLSIDVRPGGFSGVSKGFIKLEFDGNSLVYASDSLKTVESPAAKHPHNISNAFTLYGSDSLRTPTKTRVRAVLETQSLRQVSNEIEIDVAPTTAKGMHPFIDPNGRRGVNLSGDWRIEMGGALGGMNVVQDEHNDVTGSYWISSQKGLVSGKIQGYKDGTSFKVFFIQANVQRRWRIDANFAINQSDKGFIEMNGCAFGIRPDGAVLTDTLVKDSKVCATRNYLGWRGDAASTFYASAQLKQ